MAQTNGLLLKVKLDRLGNVGLLKCLMRARCEREGCTLGSMLD